MKPTLADRIALWFSPEAGLRRLQARAAADALAKRNYDAAGTGRRTTGWARNRGDANAVIGRAAGELRMHARDLLRNNGWSRRASRTVVNSTVGWGLTPKATGRDAEQAMKLWKSWADAPTCESEGRMTFGGVQRQVMRALFADGEALVRRRWRRTEDGFPLPLQLQVLEADYLDTGKDGIIGQAGGKIVQGVEYDLLGRRAAYWIFPEHPGAASTIGNLSKRIPAGDILHLFDPERAGQARGVSWLGAAIVNLKDLDDYDDAELMKQKIAACFAAFVSDRDGTGAALGEQSTTDPLVETLEPGMVVHLAGDKQVTTASPPQVTTDQFTAKNLRKVAAGIGITYEDLTGDYSQVNFSSARMARMGFKGNVEGWQSDIMIPFCAGVWAWAMEAATFLPGVAWKSAAVRPGAEWTAPPLPLVEPDKEIRATTLAIRAGLITPSEAVRERGGDPKAHFEELAADFELFKTLDLKLDCDPSETSQAGLTQARAGVGGGAPGDAPPADSAGKNSAVNPAFFEMIEAIAVAANRYREQRAPGDQKPA